MKTRISAETSATMSCLVDCSVPSSLPAFAPVAVITESMHAVAASPFASIANSAYANAFVAGVTTTCELGLACTTAARKQDRKNKWQLRPLSLRGRTG